VHNKNTDIARLWDQVGEIWQLFHAFLSHSAPQNQISVAGTNMQTLYPVGEKYQFGPSDWQTISANKPLIVTAK
jgi:hypothetical protein